MNMNLAHWRLIFVGFQKYHFKSYCWPALSSTRKSICPHIFAFAVYRIWKTNGTFLEILSKLSTEYWPDTLCLPTHQWGKKKENSQEPQRLIYIKILCQHFLKLHCFSRHHFPMSFSEVVFKLTVRK